MTTKVDFYHLTRSELSAALIMLLKKTMAAGKKALILCPKPAASGLDDLLWTYEADAWVPHGVDGDTGADPGADKAARTAAGKAMQISRDKAKVWISTDPEQNQINAPFLFLTHGIVPASWDGAERAFVLFDGRSEAQVQQVREQWKQISAQSELTASYFVQDDEGRWQKKA